MVTLSLLMTVPTWEFRPINGVVIICKKSFEGIGMMDKSYIYCLTEVQYKAQRMLVR